MQLEKGNRKKKEDPCHHLHLPCDVGSWLAGLPPSHAAMGWGTAADIKSHSGGKGFYILP